MRIIINDDEIFRIIGECELAIYQDGEKAMSEKNVFFF